MRRHTRRPLVLLEATFDLLRLTYLVDEVNLLLEVLADRPIFLLEVEPHQLLARLRLVNGKGSR